MSGSPSEQIVVTRDVKDIMEGLQAWRNTRNGFYIADLEFTADPRKRDPNWQAAAFAGLPIAEREREYGKKWIVYDGKPVYRDFTNAHILVGSIIAPRRAKLISGWDGGPNDVNLAWALGLVFPDKNAITFIDEYYVDDGNIKDFVDIVGSRLSLEWQKLGGFSLHVADQSVFTASGVADGKAMADIMRQHGMAPIPGAISFAERRIAVEDLLTHVHSGPGNRLIPKLLVHERCGMIVEGMRGGYHYPKANMGVGGDYKPLPMKNKFSHILNAVEYACSRLDIASQPIPFEGRPLPRVSVV